MITDPYEWYTFLLYPIGFLLLIGMTVYAVTRKPKAKRIDYNWE